MIEEAINGIDEDFRAGRITPTADDEDVHTFLERVLTERLGALGGKLRAGRSRNAHDLTTISGRIIYRHGLHKQPFLQRRA